MRFMEYPGGGEGIGLLPLGASLAPGYMDPSVALAVWHVLFSIAGSLVHMTSLVHPCVCMCACSSSPVAPHLLASRALVRSGP